MVLQNQRGPQDGARVVEGNHVPRISVMRHRCTGCWCQRASPSVELEQECSFSALLLSLSPPLSLPMYVKGQSIKFVTMEQLEQQNAGLLYQLGTRRNKIS